MRLKLDPHFLMRLKLDPYIQAWRFGKKKHVQQASLKINDVKGGCLKSKRKTKKENQYLRMRTRGWVMRMHP